MPYVNEQMLIGHHLGLKGKVKKALGRTASKSIGIKADLSQIF
ncbi:hypothetical protein ACEQPO_08915 [Bacillus sp. SL00103]